MERTFHIQNLEEMKRLAQKIATHLVDGFVLCLEGDLGAGKTTFTQFLGKAMGINDHINSPTFTIMKIYEHELTLYHIDAYRLENQGSDADLEDIIGLDGVTVIEWYENIIDSLPEAFLSLRIEWLSETARKVTMKGKGYYESIIKAFDY